ncbi:MAG: leucine-rich repeat domain-containing protein, partial [Clostridia bacterium]|nr:leucine-rich repeat domain-containing protein [Clostridia bacterium]
MSHDVFISYSHKDRLTANKLCHKLEEEKIRCWMAPRDVNPGGSWAGEIADAIPNAKVMVLILSANSNASKQVLREVELAINNDIVLIPLRIEDIMPTGSMSYFLSTTHWIDAIDNTFDSKYDALSNRIKSILNVKEVAVEDKKVQAIIVKEKKKKKKFPLKPVLLITALVLLIGLIIYMILGGFASLKNYLSENTSLFKSSATQGYQPSYKPYVVNLPESTPSPTPEIIYTPKDYGLNPVQTVQIPDEGLKSIILSTLENMGTPVSEEITVNDLFALRYLIIASEEWFSQNPEINEIYPLSRPDDTAIKNLDGLQYAQNLQALIIVNKDIRDISFLSGLDNLTLLNLSGNNIENVLPVKDLKKLISLNLENNLVEDVTYLGGLSNLEILNLSANRITDLRALSLLTNLKEFSFTGNALNRLTDVNGLSDLNFIEMLDVDGNELYDITALSTFSNLKTLNISNSLIKDLTPLSKLINLRSLYFNCIGFSSISDIKGLSDLTFLTQLSLEYNSITDISGLSKLTHLENLWIQNNSINDISVLEGLLKLKYIGIDSFTYINNLATIKKINAFSYIDVIESEDNSMYTPEEFNLDPNQVVEISDTGLRDSIFIMMEKAGTPMTGSITIQDLFEIEELAFISTRYLDSSPDIVNEFPDVIAADTDILSLEGLQYAYNLRTLMISDKNLQDINAIKNLINLKKIIFSGNNISDF